MAAKSKDDRKLFEKQYGQSGIHVDSTVTPYLPEGSPVIGGFATVEKGEHKGRYGVVEQVVAFDSKGWPVNVNFRTRDNDHSLLVVKYSDLKASEAGRR